ncbi:TonB C-terminal domain-containing protein [uncultured Desulfosarcina sp.]|uniref:TonB C-terminal domain-containing protein n=1 Tax=uncultured Desulfosarcina sp. TaxID=218289 RepID=UPI0029C677DE|nr:TonB C-terminal domain-containing protein [uncultured Desulfosarcina sp.]
MKKNIRVPVSSSQDLRGDGQTPLFYPVALSLVSHVVFLLLFVITPSLRSEKFQTQSVINVSMVSLKNPATEASEKPAVENKAPKIEKPEVVKKPSITPPVKKAATVADTTPPKPKTSLKKKTFKSTQVVKRAIEQLEKQADVKTDEKADAPEPEPLKSALERLRQEVGKAEANRSTPSGKSADPSAGKAGGKLGKFNENGKKTAELIDLYRIEIAYQIQKNWAFNEQMAGGDQSLVAAIVFKVMPDGEIRDIFFTDRSGNTYLDESAYKAIVKSNPVDRHPDGLAQPYVVMAIRFTPQGIR